jgi:chemotaxis protein MotB
MAAAFVSCVGCVTQGKYDQAVQSADNARTQLRRETARDAADANERDALRASLADATDQNAKLKQSLAAANENGTTLASEKDSLASSLERAKRNELIADGRAIFYREIALKLKSMIDAGELSIVLRDGRMVLQLPSDVLFPSGQADVRPRSQTTIKQIANVLKAVPNRAFQVAGHTDNVPIETDRYHSNWDLSFARAYEVTRLLIADGMSASSLSAAAYGSNDPVAPNNDDKGRAKNRRIEITVQPNIDEIIWIPGTK